MISGVPLTKEKSIWVDPDQKISIIKLSRGDCTLYYSEKDIISAVLWRNNLERVPHSEFYACSFCASNMHAEVIIEDKIKQSKKYACSVCATNRAFGIENKDVKK